MTLAGNGIREAATVLELSPPTPETVRKINLYLSNPYLFPHRRSHVITIVGELDPDLRHSLIRNVRRLGFGLYLEPDTIAMVARRGKARVVYCDDPRYLPLAQYWAHRAETVYGSRYVVVPSEQDYLALEKAGALIPQVLDFGGTFSLPAKRGGWVEGAIDQRRITPDSSPVVERLTDLQQMEERTIQIHRTLKAMAAGGGQAAPPPPPNGSPVDVVFYTGYDSGLNWYDEPLDFYNSSSQNVVSTYTDAICASTGTYCRPDVVVSLLDFRSNSDFTTFCGKPAHEWNWSKQGYDCDFDEAQGTETNYTQVAVEKKAKYALNSLKTNNNYTIRNVVVIAHWLDIPYREKLYPYWPRYNGINNYIEDDPINHTPTLVSDADLQDNDADNDVGDASEDCAGPGQWQGQNRSTKHDGYPLNTCGHDSWEPRGSGQTPDTFDPFDTDDFWDGDTGSQDYRIADFHDDGGTAPNPYAHAGFGRICGHDPTDAITLINTANSVLDGSSAAPGATIIQGQYGGFSSGWYDDPIRILECRYGSGSPLIESPCVASLGGTSVCPNETQIPSEIQYSPNDFLNMAVTTGEIVQMNGHQTNWFRTDNQMVQFNGATADPMAASLDIEHFSYSFPPGVWNFYGSNVFTYAFLNPAPAACKPGIDCYQHPPPQGCDPACLAAHEESSFTHALIPRGVLALRGSVGGHSPPPGVVVGDFSPLTWLSEITRSTPLGKANARACNRPLDILAANPGKWYEVPALLIGDPLVALPQMGSGCPDAPAFVVGPGPAPQEQPGTPVVQGFTMDGSTVEYEPSFDPYVGTVGSASYYGNEVATGNLDNSVDGSDEIAVTHGPGPNYDSLVKIFRVDGTLITSFFGFSTGTGYGAHVQVGKVRDSVGRDEIVVGRGPGAAFGPTLRIWKWNALGSAWQTSSDYTAGFSTGYGIEIATGDFDNDGLDEIATGKGPGDGYNSEVRFFDADGGSFTEKASLRISSTFPSQPNTYGVTLGAADLDGDGYAELLAGKGPGDQAGLPSPKTMTDDIAIYRTTGGVFNLVGTITDPYGMVASGYGGTPGTLAGARATGYESGDGGAGEELLLAHGPVNHYASCSSPPLGNPPSPPNFRGSRILGYDVTVSGGFSGTKIMNRILLPLKEPCDHTAPYDGPTTKGLRMAPIVSVALTPPPTGSQAHPVRPWESAKEMTQEFERLFDGGPNDLFLRTESKGDIVGALAAMETKLDLGDKGGARSDWDALVALVAGETTNETSRDELVWQIGLLKASLDQELANRAPIPVVEADHMYEAPFGGSIKVPLEGGMSRDPDSTPGTNDNIRYFRWYDDKGKLLGEGRSWLAELDHDGLHAVTQHNLTLELEDAYGAKAQQSFTITLVAK